jgi:hypothetical protein
VSDAITRLLLAGTDVKDLVAQRMGVSFISGSPTALSISATVEVLADRGLLRDPLEPTLADVRAKIEALHSGWMPGPMTFNGPDGFFAVKRNAHVLLRSDVLALLEPKKPEPRYRWIIPDRRSLQYLIQDRDGNFIAECVNVRDAETVTDALNARGEA